MILSLGNRIFQPWSEQQSAPSLAKGGKGGSAAHLDEKRREALPLLGSEIMDAAARTQHSFGGSLSAGSTPIFASKYAFFKAFFKI